MPVKISKPHLEDMRFQTSRDTLAKFYFDLAQDFDELSPKTAKYYQDCARNCLANDAKGLLMSKRKAIHSLKEWKEADTHDQRK